MLYLKITVLKQASKPAQTFKTNKQTNPKPNLKKKEKTNQRKAKKPPQTNQQKTRNLKIDILKAYACKSTEFYHTAV